MIIATADLCRGCADPTTTLPTRSPRLARDDSEPQLFLILQGPVGRRWSSMADMPRSAWRPRPCGPGDQETHPGDALETPRLPCTRPDLIQAQADRAERDREHDSKMTQRGHRILQIEIISRTCGTDRCGPPRPSASPRPGEIRAGQADRSGQLGSLFD